MSDAAYLWQLAKRTHVEPLRLRGDHWPEFLATRQIAQLHFPGDECRAKRDALYQALEQAVLAGRIECEATCVVMSPAFHEIPELHIGTVLTAAGFPAVPTNGPGSRVLEKPADVSWDEFLEQVVRGTRKSQQREDCAVRIIGRYPCGVPSRWTVTCGSTVATRDHVLDYQTCAIVHASSYAAWEGRPALPDDSPLAGWIDINGNLTVDLTGERDSDQSDRSLGRSRRAQLQDFAARNEDRADERKREWARWRAKSTEIQAGRQRKASKRKLADLVKTALSLPDAPDTIRKRL